MAIDLFDAVVYGALNGGGSSNIEPLSVTENGTYTAPSGVDGYSPVTVNVSGGDPLVPADGKTRIWIHIDDSVPENRLTFYLCFASSVANNTTVDWGDGITETLGNVSVTNYPHLYASSGDYVIVVTVNTGTVTFGGSSNYTLYGDSGSSNGYNRARVQRIIFGDNIIIGQYTCYRCYCEEITLSDDITEIGDYAIDSCYSLKKMTVSSGIVTIGNFGISNCYKLESLDLPDTLVSIGNYFIYTCHNILSITIPSRVTSIGDYAFGGISGLSEIHLKPSTPPTLGKTVSLPSDVIIYVPYSADHSILQAYQTATNWSTYASKMQEETTA